MQISELIATLQLMEKEYGDLTVTNFNSFPIEEIAYVSDPDNEKVIQLRSEADTY